MRTIIITINILLLILILYNFLLRGDKLIENLENCDAENALTAKINNTYNILDRIKKKKNEATSMVKNSKKWIKLIQRAVKWMTAMVDQNI